MFLSVFAVVAFMMMGMAVQAQDTNVDDLNALQAKKQQIEADLSASSATDAKATYYTNLVAYYDLVIADVEENGKTLIRAAQDNVNAMPVMADGTRNMRDFPRITGLALKKN